MCTAPDVAEVVDYCALLLEKIKDNGGYHANRDSYDLAWNVKLHLRVRPEEIRRHIAESHFINEADLVLHHPQVDEFIYEQLTNNKNIDEWAREAMCESVNDADTYKMISPEVAQKYGYTGKLGLEEPFDMKFSFAGRSGGYITIEEFEGRKGDRFRDYLDPEENEDDEYEQQWALHLLMCIEECDKMFTQVAARDEYEYQIAFYIAQELLGD